MKRHKHNLSHYKLATLDMGKLVPVSCLEVLPGDTLQGHTSALIRVSPLVAPVMHPVMVRLHSWFVPYRIVWQGWEDFITGGDDGLGGDAGEFPIIHSDVSGFAKGSLADYLGVPPGVGNLQVSALPFRAYAKIFNENYRDQDLVPEVGLTDESGLDQVTNKDVLNIAWEKDYFTQSRPWPQKGPDVIVPLGDKAPLRADVADGAGVTAQNASGIYRDLGTAGAALVMGTIPGGGAGAGLYADLNNATGPTVNDLRRATAIQRYQEMRAMYGSRFTEYLRMLGIRSSDARLQRPEYLGGGKQTIAFSEVLRTGSETVPVDPGAAPIGEMKGHGIAAMRQNRWRRFFEEHGVVITMMSVRPRTIYANYLPRMWSKRTKEDYWQKELEHIGHQEIYRREVFAEADSNGQGGDKVFGYNDRYAEYRHEQSTIAGDFRDTLDFWHLARILGGPPALNQSFVECDPSKRIHAVQTEQVLWCMVNNNVVARRMLSKRVSYRIF